MKNAFTLIELLISISIILLMAVVAIPAFDSYSDRSDTAAKAEEIKYIIEKAYSATVSPENNLDGSMIGLRYPESDQISLFKGLYAPDCYGDINGANCRGWNATNPSNIFTHSESVIYAGYSINNSLYTNSPGSGFPFSDMQIKLINDPNGDGVYFCPFEDDSYNCDRNYTRSELILTKNGGSDSYKITIFRYPFRVEVEKD